MGARETLPDAGWRHADEKRGVARPSAGPGTALPRCGNFPSAPTAEDWTRWALECFCPDALIIELRDSGHLAEYPEIAALIGVPQEPEWHPEGTVDRHTGFVVEAAAAIAQRENLPPEERVLLMISALTHDFGKPATTVRRKKGSRLCWTSYDHDEVGAPIAGRFARRLGFPEEFTRKVVILVRHHMAYLDFRDPRAGERAAHRLAQRIAPVTLRQLGYLMEADHSGRPPLPRQLPDCAQRLLRLGERTGMMDGTVARGDRTAISDITKSSN